MVNQLSCAALLGPDDFMLVYEASKRGGWEGGIGTVLCTQPTSTVPWVLPKARDLHWKVVHKRGKHTAKLARAVSLGLVDIAPVHAASKLGGLW